MPSRKAVANEKRMVVFDLWSCGLCGRSDAYPPELENLSHYHFGIGGGVCCHRWIMDVYLDNRREVNREPLLLSS